MLFNYFITLCCLKRTFNWMYSCCWKFFIFLLLKEIKIFMFCCKGLCFLHVRVPINNLMWLCFDFWLILSEFMTCNFPDFTSDVVYDFIKLRESYFILLMMTSALFWRPWAQVFSHLSKNFVTSSRLFFLKYFSVCDHKLGKLKLFMIIPRSMVFLFINALFF